MKKILFSLFIILILTSCSKQKKEAALEKCADSYFLDSRDRLYSIETNYEKDPTYISTKNLIENMEISLIKTQFYVVKMEQAKLTIRVPLDKQEEVGLRKISSKKIIDEVFNILKLKPKIRRIMWSRREQEYDTKIFSGDPIKIGEVVRDLFRKNSQPEQSYSERQMFQVALERLAREVAAVEKTDYFQATEKIEKTLFNK